MNLWNIKAQINDQSRINKVTNEEIKKKYELVKRLRRHKLSKINFKNKRINKKKHYGLVKHLSRYKPCSAN